jgi:hypothetical protein
MSELYAYFLRKITEMIFYDLANGRHHTFIYDYLYM